MSSIYKNPLLMGRAVVNMNNEDNGIGYVVATLLEGEFVVEYDHDIVGDRISDLVGIINRSINAAYPLIDYSQIFISNKRKRAYDIVQPKDIKLLYEDDQLKHMPANKEAMLRETIRHFNSTNRAEIGCKCKYSLGCAIGRYLDDDTCQILDGFGGATSVSVLFNMLPDELKVHGKRFLILIQHLHDNSHNWSQTGLSRTGVDNVNTIITEFKLDYDKVFLIC